MTPVAPTATAGTCKYCGCTERHACAIPDLFGGFIPCSWWNREGTVCSNPDCIRKELTSLNPENNYYAIVTVEVRQIGANPAFTRHVTSKAESHFALDYFSAMDLVSRSLAVGADSQPGMPKKRAVKSSGPATKAVSA